jgi:hypothetical protein
MRQDFARKEIIIACGLRVRVGNDPIFGADVKRHPLAVAFTPVTACERCRCFHDFKLCREGGMNEFGLVCSASEMSRKTERLAGLYRAQARFKSSVNGSPADNWIAADRCAMLSRKCVFARLSVCIQLFNCGPSFRSRATTSGHRECACLRVTRAGEPCAIQLVTCLNPDWPGGRNCHGLAKLR